MSKKIRRLPPTDHRKVIDVLVPWGETSESPFSRAHAELTPEGCCWICHIPYRANIKSGQLRKTRDHVIPRVFGGGSLENNIRPAHAYCNHRRGSSELTPEIVAICQEFITKLLERRES